MWFDKWCIGSILYKKSTYYCYNLIKFSEVSPLFWHPWIHLVELVWTVYSLCTFTTLEIYITTWSDCSWTVLVTLNRPTNNHISLEYLWTFLVLNMLDFYLSLFHFFVVDTWNYFWLPNYVPTCSYVSLQHSVGGNL